MSEQEVEAVLPPSETLGGPTHVRDVGETALLSLFLDLLALNYL